MDYKEIEHAWDDDGFLGKLKDGIFDKDAYNELCTAFLKLRGEEFDYFEKEFVSCVWFIPSFMARQKPYVKGISSHEFDELQENIVDLIAAILGYP